MKVRRHSFGVVALTLSLSAVARAGDPGPPPEPEVAPYEDETVPPGEAPPQTYGTPR